MTCPCGVVSDVGRICRRFFPAKVDCPSTVQVLPPSVLSRTPPGSPPDQKEVSTQLPLPKLPVAANSVLPVLSSGLKARAPMARVGRLSVSGTQVGTRAVALVVFQMPPFVVPA